MFLIYSDYCTAGVVFVAVAAMPADCSSMEEESMSTDGGPQRRPMKVWDYRRQIKHGIVASCLHEVIEKGRQRLQLPSNCRIRVVLECDGTVVDDDEYLATLDAHTILMLLVDDQEWSDAKPLEYSVAFGDEPDAAAIFNRHLPAELSPAAARRHQLLRQLRSDPGYIALLSGSDLELLTTPLEQLSVPAAAALEAEFDQQLLEEVQEASCCYLDGRRDVQEALSFIKKIKGGHSGNDSGNGGIAFSDSAATDNVVSCTEDRASS